MTSVCPNFRLESINANGHKLPICHSAVVYFGPINGGLQFVQSVDPNMHMDQGYNEAEFLVDWVTDADRQGRGDELASLYNASKLAQQNMQELEE